MMTQGSSKPTIPGKETIKSTEESQAATKASIIVVHGKVLDKIGFGVAERANRSAELRLSKTLNTLEVMAVKEHAKYRKEKYSLESQLEKLNGYRLKLRRAKLKKRLTADDLYHDVKQETIMGNTEANRSGKGGVYNHIQT